MANLALSNVINISAAQAQAGVNAFNTSNLALFTDDQPQAAVQTVTFGAVAASGSFTLAFGGTTIGSLAWNATLAAIQAAVAAVPAIAQVTVTGSIASQSLVFTWPGVLGPIPTITVTANSLQTSGSVAITLSPVVTNAGWSGGTLGYSLYVSPTGVATDFGSNSKTAQMAASIFSQQPNILAGSGELIVIPFAICKQTLTFSAAPTSGAFVATYNSNSSASISWNSTPAAIQTILQAVPGLSQVQVTGSIASTVLTVWMYGVYGVNSLAIGTSSNTLNSSITITQAYGTTGESWGTAITRTQGLVSYFGCMVNELCSVIGQTDLLAAAAIIQALNNSCIGFAVSNLSADINPGGMIDLLRSSTDNNTRGLYYGDTTVVGGIAGINALLFMASYVGLGLSTNFNGSNTTQTMHLKSLATVSNDPTMTQTILNLAIAAGADTYPSLQGVPKVFCSGANSYYDQVYNLGWFVTALQVAGFNYLAQSSTKIPQTEPGMDGLKTAYRGVCQQGVANQYLAPGTWTSSTTFGVQQDFLNNIAQVGYYIWSQPVAQQSAAARAARQAPLVQIAAKQAGAVQSSSVIVYINA
jgi:hypothetical protein